MMVGGREAMEEERESFPQSLLKLHPATYRLDKYLC